MSDALLIAARRLADLLAQENAALAQMDLPRAAALLPEKQEAANSFAAARQAAPAAATAPPLIALLRDLAEQNRRLLERGIAVQGDVIGLVATALRSAGGPPRYAASGALALGRQPVAFALSARA
jgi:hypothetical protein